MRFAVFAVLLALLVLAVAAYANSPPAAATQLNAKMNATIDNPATCPTAITGNATLANLLPTTATALTSARGLDPESDLTDIITVTPTTPAPAPSTLVAHRHAHPLRI